MEVNEEDLPEAEIVDESSLVARFGTESIEVDLGENTSEPEFEVTEVAPEVLSERKAWIMAGIVRRHRKIEGGLMAMVRVSSIEKEKTADLRLAPDTPKKEAILEGKKGALKGPKDGLYLVMKTKEAQLKILGERNALKITQSTILAAFDRIQNANDFDVASHDAEVKYEKRK